jgi:hypothetical protein
MMTSTDIDGAFAFCDLVQILYVTEPASTSASHHGITPYPLGDAYTYAFHQFEGYLAAGLDPNTLLDYSDTTAFWASDFCTDTLFSFALRHHLDDVALLLLHYGATIDYILPTYGEGNCPIRKHMTFHKFVDRVSHKFV